MQTTSSITLQWTAPAELGGDTVSEYVLYMDDGSGESAAVSIVAYRGELSSSVLVDGLDGGRSYKFAVSALSASGEGDRGEVVTQSTSPAAGAAPVSVSQTASSIELSWTAPSVSTGLDATGYLVFDSVTSAVVYDGTGSLATTAVVSGLESGRLYSYAVSALSGSGSGDVSASVSVSTAPGVVTGVSSTLQTTSSISLQWDAPVVSTGSAVSGYKVYERVVHEPSAVSDLFESGGVSPEVLDHFLDPAESDMVIDTLVYDGRGNVDVRTTLSGLTGGTEYEYVLGVMSEAGEGNRSTSVTVSTSPAAVSGLRSVAQTTSGVELEWTAPVASTGLAVTDYVVYRDDGAGGAVEAVVECGGDGGARRDGARRDGFVDARRDARTVVVTMDAQRLACVACATWWHEGGDTRRRWMPSARRALGAPRGGI